MPSAIRIAVGRNDHRLCRTRCCAVADDRRRPGQSPSVGIKAIDWIRVSPRSARPARETSLFGKSALEADRDEKARSVVALSRVPRLAGFTGSLRLPALQLVHRPLVLNANRRHTTTGTCDLGRHKHMLIRLGHKSFLDYGHDFFGRLYEKCGQVIDLNLSLINSKAWLWPRLHRIRPRTGSKASASRR